MGKLLAAGDGDLLKWLGPMVVANFECDDPSNYSPHRYYCTTCYSVFFRKKTSSNSSVDSIGICPNSSPKNHQLHKILQVYKASHAFSVRIKDIEALWNPSNICEYVINKHDIYFIQQKQKPSSKSLVGNNHRISRRGYCRICGYALLQPEASFCSIQCKLTELKTLSRVQQTPTIGVGPLEVETRISDTITDNDNNNNKRMVYAASSVMSFLAATAATTIQLSQSLRKRPRKSLCPRRSPLF